MFFARRLAPAVPLALVAVLAACPAACASIIVQAGGTDYVAFEAENAQKITTTGPKSWIVVSTASPITSPVGLPVLPAGSNASGAQAILADFGIVDNQSTAFYRLKFDSPGTYRLYVRQSAFESGMAPENYFNEDSFFRPTALDGPGNIISGSSSFTEGTYGWLNTGGDYVITAEHLSSPFVTLQVNNRERGYSLDRIVLSKVNNLAGTALDALGNSGGAALPGKPFLYYALEAPNPTATTATDYSLGDRHGTFSAAGTGTFAYEADAPPVLAGTQSLRLTEAGDSSAARLTRDIPTSQLNFSTQSWTFSGWFKRADNDTPDFIFHLGDGDGFGGGNELYLYGVDNSNNLALHGFFNDVQDVNLTVAGGAPVGQWRHVALVRDAGAGVLSLYLDGVPAGSDNSFSLNLPQSGTTVVFGGHDNPGFAASRWFNGNLDDLALFNYALSPYLISELARGVSPLGVPEPSCLVLLVLGGAGLGLCAWRRRRR